MSQTRSSSGPSAGPVMGVSAPGLGPTPEDWALMLEPGETMLWWGRPLSEGRADSGTRILTLIGGLFFLIGALFTPIGILADAELMFRLIFSGLGLIFAITGAGLLIVPRLQRRRRAALTQYALSDRRALVFDGETFQNWPIQPGMRLDYQPGQPGSLIFGEERQALMVNDRPTYRPCGFLNIADAAQVLGQIRALQANQLQANQLQRTGAAPENPPKTDQDETHYG
ncbi:hypothetical protein [Paracoccus aminophilus]|uniref:Uncharacterized protein n=1 Tax=Paracoccus aminophilus JCM 7686 TaxID=1367847 RepID=S5YQB5_PARAH|nr:hypothetical protein [Paracoccus aminophilus]AGT07466.1 hypothetical protein JCM7686_0357 [Paracoccus aminophilus JCM 7686]